MPEILEILNNKLKQSQIRQNEPLKQHITFKVGGPADIFVLPENAEELSFVIKKCIENNIRYFVLGNGSNILFKDKGFRGVVISTKNMVGCKLLDDCIIECKAGTDLCDISAFALTHNLAGFEFACGIPGSMGGAVFMNAGAYDGELSSVFHYADVVEKNGDIIRLNLKDMDFSYRESIVHKEGLIVTAAAIKLKHGKYDEIKAIMDDLTQKREEKQPLEMPSAGSTFKRPPGRFAGKLIMDSGLRGYRLGGAQVSEKHCGFVINRNDATAEDILNLIEYIKKVVYEKYEVTLEPEVRVIGE